MEKYQSGLCSATIHSAVSYCVVGESKRTAIDYGTASIEIERENIRLEPEHYLTRLKITNISGGMVKLMAAYPIITDDLKIGTMPSEDWNVLNGARQLNDVPATCVLGVKDHSFEEAVTRLSDEGMQERNFREGDTVLYGDGITVIKAGRFYVSLEVLTNEHQLTDISISSDCRGDVKAVRLGGEFNCLMESDDVRYTDWVRICTGGNFVRLIEDYAANRKAMNTGTVSKDKKSIYMIDDDFGSDAISEKLTFLRGLRAPFEYIELGKGWQSSVGDWESCYGLNMSLAASRINQSGYKAGIWTSPFIMDRNSELFESEKKWILRHADGSACTYTVDGCTYAVLDVSSEECLEWITMLYQRLSAMGFYMHQVDHTKAFVIQKDVVLLDPTITMAEAYLRAMRAIRHAIGSEGYLCVTNGFAAPLSGIADCVQVVSGAEEMKNKARSNVIPRLINQAALRGYMASWWHNGCGHNIDRDFTSKYSIGENRSLLVCEYLCGGKPQVCNLSTNDELKILRQVMPSVKTKIYARDAFEENAYINVVDAEVNDDYHTLCFFNHSFVEKELIFRLDNKTCGGYVDHASNYNVSSYFGRVRVRECVYDDIIKLGMVPANSCEIVKIVKSDRPHVILSDMHFSMGGEVSIENTGASVKVSGNNLFNIRGNYVISLPKGLVCADGRDEFSFTVNGQGPFTYEKQIKQSE